MTSIDAVAATFAAYTLPLFFVYPLAAILLLTRERQRGTLSPALPNLSRQVAGMFGELLAVWMATWIVGLAALALWRWNGGALDASALLTVLLGNVLRAALVVSVAMVAAAATSSATRGAALTFLVTFTIWWLDYMGRTQGGLVQILAERGPEGMLRAFDRGEVRANVIGVMLVTVASHLALTVVWLLPSLDRGDRWAATLTIILLSAVLSASAGALPGTWHASAELAPPSSSVVTSPRGRPPLRAAPRPRDPPRARAPQASPSRLLANPAG